MSNEEQKDSRRFTIISWLLTAVIVFGLLGASLWWKTTQAVGAPAVLEPEPTAEPDQPPQQVPIPILSGSENNHFKIDRKTDLKTDIPERPRYHVESYTVQRGDSVFAISNRFNIEPETVLWSNYNVLKDDPHGLKVGQELRIPPVDGILYQWQEGDTIESVSGKFKADPAELLTFPGNELDLTNPTISVGQWVMVPGGEREFVQWLIPTVARGRSGTSNVGGTACGAGPIGSGFIWPTANQYLSGNDYWSGHLAIDIAAGEGAAVSAASSGIVTMAQGGWNYGYGNVVQIDHGNGYATLYAHLSQINVRVCQPVRAGQLIGLAGNTGNSFGAHLHFEVRLNGGFINPWFVLP